MGQARAPQPVKLLVGLLGADEDLLAGARQALAERLGPLDQVSALIPFTYTRYYEAELGAGLWRQFVAVRDLADPGCLAATKHLTNALEAATAVGGRRRVNLDPGYLTPGKLVLATTKDHAHRVYLGDGIYAEVTLAYRGGRFAPWPWTYPDYASGEYSVFLLALRERYMAQLRALGG